jgi:hypothetical protein
VILTFEVNFFFLIKSWSEILNETELNESEKEQINKYRESLIEENISFEK